MMRSSLLLAAVLMTPCPASQSNQLAASQSVREHAAVAASAVAADVPFKRDTTDVRVDTAMLRKQLRYPQRFYDDRARGFVMALYTVDRKGVGRQVAIRHHGGGDDSAAFGKAVTDAMKGVRFVPARVNGKTIDAAVMVVVSFNVGLADGKIFPEFQINLRPISAREAREMSEVRPSPPPGTSSRS
jgi:TonB family protein